MLPLNAISFIKLFMIKLRYINIQTIVKMINNKKIIAAGVTAKLIFEKLIPSNRQ